MPNNSQNQYSLKHKVPFKILPEKLSPLLRLNAVCPYYTMFPLDFPFNSLKEAKPNDWVLDPFCGRGTTNFAARLKALPSVGIDSNPVATAIAQAKFVNPKPARIVKICKEIIDNASEPENVPQEKFWEICYHPSTLVQICKLREHFLIDCSTDEKIALRALILGILHGPLRKTLPSFLSNQMPRTYATKPNSAINFWESRKMDPPEIDVVDVVERRAKFLFTAIPPKSRGEILLLDSRSPFKTQSKTKFNWVITSPPYYGMNTYTQDQWIRKWFLGGESYVKYGLQNQLSQGSESDFVFNLSLVWKRIADVCAEGAQLIIRFGSLPSLACDPASLLEKSLTDTHDEWEILNVQDAGIPPRGKRQSEQFNSGILGVPQSEIDFRAIFTG